VNDALSRRTIAVALWTVCALVLLTSYAAVVGTTESLTFGNIVLAQRYTRLYVLAQPAAAALFLVALALAGGDDALAALFGPPSTPRRVLLVVVAVAGSLLAVIFFLGGGDGPWLPPVVWLPLKTIGVMALLVATRRWFASLAPAPRLAIATAAALAGFANVAATVLRAAP
jgi:hypothetical protein